MSRRAAVARRAAATLLNVTAVLLFTVGLLAPLTPSESLPTWQELALFGFGPCALLGAAAWSTTSRAFRLIVALQGLAVVVALTLLLIHLLRTS